MLAGEYYAGSGCLHSVSAKRPRLSYCPVTVDEKPSSVTTPKVAPVTAPSASIQIELPGRTLVSVESGVDPELVRTVLGNLIWCQRGTEEQQVGYEVDYVVDPALQGFSFTHVHTTDPSNW